MIGASPLLYVAALYGLSAASFEIGLHTQIATLATPRVVGSLGEAYSLHVDGGTYVHVLLQ